MNCYNSVTAEGTSIETNKFRYGSGGGSNTITATVEVTDGQLNFVQTISKSGYFNIIFSAIEIEETDDSFATRKAAYDTAKSEYDSAVAAAKAASANAQYVYTDTGLTSNKTYSYQIAAVVDGKTSYMSKALEATTLISISSVEDFELDDIVCGTPVTTDATELLPATVTVVDEEGNEQEAAITWDITNLDINTVGEYTVTGTVKGYSETLTKTVKVIENEIKGVEELADLKVVVGSASAGLPETVNVEYTNTTSDTVAVTWDTSSLDLNTIGSYELNGTIEGYTFVPTITVNVVADYPVSVDAISLEVAVGDTIVKNLPSTMSATMASGNTADVEVTWKTDGVDDIDTSSSSDQIIHGTVDGLDQDIVCNVYVRYPALYKFDFGIYDATAADDWTTVTVNPKGGEKTISDLKLAYSEEQGWGFIGSDDTILQGRQESVTGSGLYPTNVATDFMLSAGLTFVADVPNGTYQVSVMTNCGIGSSSATIDVEGTSASFSCSKSFTVKDYKVEVTDGQLTIKDNSSLSRIGAIVVRTVCAHEAAEAVTENMVAATCVAAGSYDSVVYCSKCGAEISRETVTLDIDEKAHQAAEAVVENNVAATCYATGSYDSVVYCSDENCKAEISRETVEIPALGHTAAEAVEENRVEPTCTETGSYDSVVYCSVCGEELSRETVTIDALGHAESAEVIKPATLFRNGRVYTYCTVCDEILSDRRVARIKAVNLSEDFFKADGTTHLPTVTVTDAEGNTLVEGTDYTVEYDTEDDSRAGVYAVDVTFTGYYKGHTMLTYNVARPTFYDIHTNVQKFFNNLFGFGQAAYENGQRDGFMQSGFAYGMLNNEPDMMPDYSYIFSNMGFMR